MNELVILNDPKDPILTYITKGFLGPLLTERPDLSDGVLVHHSDIEKREVLGLLVGSRFLVPENLWKKPKPDYDLALCMTAKEFENSSLCAFCKNVRTDYHIGYPVYRIKLQFNGNQDDIDLQIIDPKDWEKKCIVEKLVKLMYDFALQFHPENRIPTKLEQRKLYGRAWDLVDNRKDWDCRSVHDFIVHMTY